MHHILSYDIFLSLIRWALGLSIGCLLGLMMAVLGSLRYTSLPLKIACDFLRAIPIVALVPVVQMNVGINEYGKIGLIAWAVMFPVWISVRGSIEKRIESAEMVLQCVNPNKVRFFRLFLFPKLLGGFLKGIELAIGIAWLALVAAEWVGTFTQGFWAGGIGYKIITAYDQNNWKTVHLGLIYFGGLGLFSAYMWRGMLQLIFKRIKSFNPLN